MGPSDCGKGFLLDILARRLKGKRVLGRQFLENVNPFDDKTSRSMCAYIPREDYLIGSLTVRETIEFAAKLALLDSTSRTERKTRVQDMLHGFGLFSIQDRKIGDPSTGGLKPDQRRRVAIARRLVAMPKIVFLGI
jgi:ABC-type multidrug transport system ATPase subunit